MEYRIRRIYEDAHPSDGYRVLIDRIWPRGVSREDAAISKWAKEIAPSTELRKWFDHDPEKFGSFRERYVAELEEMDDKPQALLDAPTGTKRTTLLYGAKDTEHNHAVVLRDWLNGD